MKQFWKVAGAALVLGLTACGGETAANGEGGGAIDAEADTSRNWVEVIAPTEEGGFRMGNPNAPIKIIEYASLTCPHCAEFAEESAQPLADTYISQGLVSLELRNFVRDPLDLSAALLARCNGAEPFFPITERIFGNQATMFERIQGADQAQLQQLSTPAAVQSGQAFFGYAQLSGLIDLVGGLGIPEPRARECLADQAAIEQLQQMRNQALSQYNLSGTPTFIVNGEVAQNVYSWAQLEARLQELVQ